MISHQQCAGIRRFSFFVTCNICNRTTSGARHHEIAVNDGQAYRVTIVYHIKWDGRVANELWDYEEIELIKIEDPNIILKELL